ADPHFPQRATSDMVEQNMGIALGKHAPYFVPREVGRQEHRLQLPPYAPSLPPVTLAPTADQPSTIPLESLESLRPGDGLQRVTVKNTFVHVDGPLRRADSDEPILRTQSAPSGPSRVPTSPRRDSREVAIAEEEEKEGEDEGEDEQDEEEVQGGCDDDAPLQSTLTYDPFAAFSPTAAGGDPLGMPPMGTSSSSHDAVMWNPFGMAPYPGYGSPPWDYGMSLGEEAEIPPVGVLHCFHTESHGFGTVSPDLRQFRKGVGYEGRLSVLSEAQVHRGGRHRYLLQFTHGPLGKADGVGFVFASRLPCTKNIQKIVSVFLKQGGQIAMRIFGEIVRASGHVRPIAVGDWIEMDVDLDKSLACFKIWPCDLAGMLIPGKPDSTAEFNFAKKLSKALSKPVDLTLGHFACVIQDT
ncbi:unnamed protein product, partial [Prorocentrum cordatum]